MKILTELALLMFICLAAEIIGAMLPFSFPPALIALFLLLLLLLLKIIRVENLEEVSSFFITNMAFFFVPAGIQIISEFDALRTYFWQILLITMVSLFTTFAAAAKTVEAVELIRWRIRKRKEAGV